MVDARRRPMLNSTSKDRLRWCQYFMVGTLATVPLVGGCIDDGDELSSDDLITLHSNQAPGGQVVVDWNNTAFEAFVATDGYGDAFMHLRAWTMMHLAIHDAVNGVKPKYASYAVQLRDRKANVVAAAASAAHDVLVALYPNQQALLDARLADSLAGVPDGSGENRGIALGAAAAEAILALRTGDGSENFGEYTFGSEPGDYQTQAPWNGFVYRPAWGDVTPFGLVSADQFQSEPPPALTSARYATDYNEVSAFGRSVGSARNADQTFIADYWYELADIGWNRIARNIWETRNANDVWKTARLFALLNIALSDGYIAGWDSKFFYNLWRPQTAIQAGDTDGNPATAPDASYQNYCQITPTTEHPSTHAVLGEAAATIIASFYGRDNIAFSMASPSAIPANASRSFTRLSDAAQENAESRVMCGIHFRFSIEAGLEMGDEIGDYIFDAHLGALDDD
jgi:hypothetical protein